MISEPVKKALGALREAVDEVQTASYGKGYYAGQPLTIGEYESPAVQEHWQQIKDRSADAVSSFNIAFAVLLNTIESEGK